MHSDTLARLDALLACAPVVPVLVIEDIAHAIPIAEALVAGGISVLEVTLRTPAALAVIAAMRQVPGAVVGAGTVLNPQDLDAALAAGAEFIVSPGLTPTLGEAAVARGVPFLPGVTTASEIMAGLALGLRRFKFFPAQASGGIPALRGLAAVFGGVRFLPSGGITLANAPDWLALDAVVAVGGSWLVPKIGAGATPDAAAITAAARVAVALRSSQ